VEIYNQGRFIPYFEIGAEWPGSDLRCILEHPDGELWIGGTSGGAAYRNGRLSFPFKKPAGYTANGVFAMARLPDGHILAGGRDQLLEFDGASWSLVRGDIDRVRSILCDRAGDLWVTAASGVHRRVKGSWIDYGQEEGLPSDIAGKILQD